MNIICFHIGIKVSNSQNSKSHTYSQRFSHTQCDTLLQYTYAVADDYSGAAFNQEEQNDGNGVVAGSYSVNLPDGRVQTVTYHANDYDGYVADVTYSGEPHYDAAPVAHGPAYHPAPAYHAAPVVAHPVAHAVHAAPVAVLHG